MPTSQFGLILWEIPYITKPMRLLNLASLLLLKRNRKCKSVGTRSLELCSIYSYLGL